VGWTWDALDWLLSLIPVTGRARPGATVRADAQGSPPGTVGCLVRWGNECFILSCRHVFGEHIDPRTGMCLVVHERGRRQRKIGVLTDGISKQAPVWDAALIGPVSPWNMTKKFPRCPKSAVARTRQEQRKGACLGRIDPTLVPETEVRTDMPVQMVGGTTGHIAGRVSGTMYEMRSDNGTRSVDILVPRFEIEVDFQVIGKEAAFCQEGDSGAVVLTRSERGEKQFRPRPLALLAQIDVSRPFHRGIAVALEPMATDLGVKVTA